MADRSPLAPDAADAVPPDRVSKCDRCGKPNVVDYAFLVDSDDTVEDMCYCEPDAVPQTPTAEPTRELTPLLDTFRNASAPNDIFAARLALVQFIAGIESRLASLTADNQRMTADSARLDWLDTQREPVSRDGETLEAYAWGIYAQASDVRNAIDMCRARSGEERERPTSEAT